MNKVLCVLPFALILHSCSKKSDSPAQPVSQPAASTSATSSTSSVSSVSSSSSTSTTHVFIPNNYKGYLVIENDSFPLIAAVCEAAPKNAPYYRMVSYTCDTCADFIELIIDTPVTPLNRNYPIMLYSDLDPFRDSFYAYARITLGFNGIQYNSLRSGNVAFLHDHNGTTATFSNAILMKEYDMHATHTAHGILISE